MPTPVVTRSPLAIQASKQWNATDRPTAWIPVFGAFTHTTGSGLPVAAEKEGRDPVVKAVEIYNRTHGCNYVMGWAGSAGGLLQIADEREQASGVGVSKGQPSQWDSVQKGPGNWKKDLPAALVKRWQERWPGFANPLDVLPRSKFANAPYVQIEMIPCWWVGMSAKAKASNPAPAAPGLRFTMAQHLGIAALYVDLAHRHGWTGEWWRTPRMVGHEDVTPISRSDKSKPKGSPEAGGWDPGFLRADPYFSWDLVLDEVGRLLKIKGIEKSKLPRSAVYSKPGPYSGL